MTPMRFVIPRHPLLAVLAASVALSAPYTRAAAPSGQELASFVSTTFERVDRLADMPADVRKGLASALGARPIAEADQEWNPGCVQDELPGQRFIFAGRSSAMWFIFIERGGIARHQVLFTMRKSREGDWALASQWPVDRPANTIDELKAAVAGASKPRPTP